MNRFHGALAAALCATSVLMADPVAATAGEFPVLKPGDNVITGSGWSRLDITRRERFL